MAEEPDEERLRRLETRMSERKQAAPSGPTPVQGAGWSQGEVAWRMVIELVSGLLLGLAIGYGLDWLFGTMPVMLVIFCLLGFAAGIRTMLGTAREMREKHEADMAAGRMPPAMAAKDAPGDGGDERD